LSTGYTLKRSSVIAAAEDANKQPPNAKERVAILIGAGVRPTAIQQSASTKG
jgi:copper homeostasis protein CutC